MRKGNHDPEPNRRTRLPSNDAPWQKNAQHMEETNITSSNQVKLVGGFNPDQTNSQLGSSFLNDLGGNDLNIYVKPHRKYLEGRSS